MKPYFSIIVPVYNRIDEVIDLLESLTFQTDNDFEIILVEDGSTEPCKEAAEKYEGKLNAVESDPSGQGINYKNFAEMIYIYFISKNYEPYEKIRRSDEMIRRLANCQGNQQSYFLLRLQFFSSSPLLPPL